MQGAAKDATVPSEAAAKVDAAPKDAAGKVDTPAGAAAGTPISETRGTGAEPSDTIKPGAGKTDVTRTDTIKPGDASKTDATKPGDASKTDATKPGDATKVDGAKPGDATTRESGGKGGGDDKPAVGAATPVVAAATTRRFRPVRLAGRAGRATYTWAKGPSGRVVIPGFVIVALVILAGTSGAYLVPKALEVAPTPSATPTFGAGADPAASAFPGDPAAGPPAGGLPGAGATGLPGAGLPGAGATGLPGAGLPGAGATGLPGAGLPTTALPGTGGTGLPGAGLPGLPTQMPTTQPAVTGTRPADALSTWATQVGTQIGIPVVAVQAYGYAELVTTKTTPSCHLSWTTLAAIAKVESDHGSFNGSVLGVDGVTTPGILGLPLDGQGGRQLIRDTDRGQLDNDTTYDRAVGPMQFIPATWKNTAVDADRDGVTNPNDIDDAALTAAVYLCKGGRDLAKADSWWDAILSYNAVRPYAQKVFQFADDYGRRSRS